MPKATIIVTGQPAWLVAALGIIAEEDHAASIYQDGAGYVTRLADARAALILVDGDGQDWTFWTTTPKSSPATRRIPVVVVSDDSARRADAVTKGADLAISAADMLRELPALLTTMARVADQGLLKALDSQCEEPMPKEGLEAITLFNEGAYYPQHDAFEALWMAESGPVRDLYRAILQVGIAYYQVTRGNQRGARKMLLRSIQWLTLLPDVCRGVDVAQLRADAAAVRAELERVGEDGMDAFDRSLLKGVRRVDSDR